MPAPIRFEIFGNDYHERENDEVEKFPWGPMEDGTPWLLPSVTTLIAHDVGPILPCVPHLTRFKFQEGAGPTEIDQLLEFGNCPLLEHVDIYYAVGTSSSRRQPVSLPSLRTYTQPMHDEYYTLRLFNMLSLHPSCTVTARCVTWPSSVKTAGITPYFRNPDYLAGISRIKLRTTGDTAGGSRIIEALGLINSRGTKVCSEKTVQFRWSSTSVHDTLNLAYLRCLQGLDARSVKILCLDGCRLWDGGGQAIGTVKDALDCLRGISTLILSGNAVKPCLLAQAAISNGPHLYKPSSSTQILKRRSVGYLSDPSHCRAEEESSRASLRVRFPVSSGEPVVERGFRGAGGVHREVRSHRGGRCFRVGCGIDVVYV